MHDATSMKAPSCGQSTACEASAAITAAAPAAAEDAAAHEASPAAERSDGTVAAAAEVLSGPARASKNGAPPGADMLGRLEGPGGAMNGDTQLGDSSRCGNGADAVCLLTIKPRTGALCRQAFGSYALPCWPTASYHGAPFLPRYSVCCRQRNSGAALLAESSFGALAADADSMEDKLQLVQTKRRQVCWGPLPLINPVHKGRIGAAQ